MYPNVTGAGERQPSVWQYSENIDCLDTMEREEKMYIDDDV